MVEERCSDRAPMPVGTDTFPFNDTPNKRLIPYDVAKNSCWNRLISSLNRIVSLRAACAKSFADEAYKIPRLELMIASSPFLSQPKRMEDFKSPPCFPIPGMRMGTVGAIERTVLSSFGCVAPTTRPIFPPVFHFTEDRTTFSYNGFPPIFCR